MKILLLIFASLVCGAFAGYYNQALKIGAVPSGSQQKTLAHMKIQSVRSRINIASETAASFRVHLLDLENYFLNNTREETKIQITQRVQTATTIVITSAGGNRQDNSVQQCTEKYTDERNELIDKTISNIENCGLDRIYELSFLIDNLYQLINNASTATDDAENKINECDDNDNECIEKAVTELTVQETIYSVQIGITIARIYIFFQTLREAIAACVAMRMIEAGVGIAVLAEKIGQCSIASQFPYVPDGYFQIPINNPFTEN